MMKMQTIKKIIPAIAVLAALILLLCACGKGDSGETLPGTEPESPYIATVTYIVSTPGEEEPMTFVLEASPEGKAEVLTDIGDTENTVWSGWLTAEGEAFDFDTVLQEDVTLYGVYYADENNNEIPDGTPEDPITVYEFRHAAGFAMLTETFFGLDAELDYTAEAYRHPDSQEDGVVFTGWAEERTVSEDGGTVTVLLTPELADDRNNNGIVDGSKKDPFVYHIFLDRDGNVLTEIQWLSGDEEVNPEDIVCPTAGGEKLMGWNRAKSQNNAGNTVYTYTPEIEEE